MSHDVNRAGVVGRTPAELVELGRSILASLDGTADVDALSSQLSRVTTHYPTPLLLDPRGAIVPPRRDEAERKLRPSPWIRVREQIAEGHFFATPSENELQISKRLATAVHSFHAASSDFLAQCLEAVEALDVEPELRSLWKLLSCVVPEQELARPVLDPIQGAKRFFEERFLDHVHKTARDFGMPTGRTQDAIRMYVHKRLCPQDTSYPAWTLVYIAIRCGDYRAATEFAAKAVFPGGSRCQSPEYYLRSLMQRPSFVAYSRFTELEQACDQFMRYGARKKLSSAYRYMLMSVAFICGQIHVADTLISESAQCWDSLDEFLWFALGCVRSGNVPASCFDYKRLRSRLSSYQEMYYTENGKHPMRYALVLFSGLQFGSALYYLIHQKMGHPCIPHVVHMAIALHHHGLLTLPEVVDPKQLTAEDVADLVLHYGHSLAASKSPMAWHYYILSHLIRQETEAPTNDVMSQALLDFLVRSRDVSFLEAENVLGSYIAGEARKNEIFHSTALRCIDRKEFELAAILYKTTGHYDEAALSCTRMAVHILEQCLKLTGSARTAQKTEKLQEVRSIIEYINETLEHATGETEMLKKIVEVLASRGIDARHTLTLIYSLRFMPKQHEEVEEMAERLKSSSPTLLPLLLSLMHLFCEAVREMKWNGTAHPNKTTVLQTLSVYQGFVTWLPCSLTSHQSTGQELVETQEFLRSAP